MSHQFYSSEGKPVSLGRKLGQGGEGAVFDVFGHDHLVAKVYLETAIAAKKAAKLSAMLTLKTERLLKLSAWPTDTLHEKSGGAVTGFLMPKVVGHHDIHILYGIKSRHVEYPEARWPFLIQAAGNVARAFSVIHDHGHVIGDVNQGGVVVSKSATVRLVDCDSFQISVSGNRYLCGVGVPTHTPPELQGRSFTAVVRTQDHDAFGLAVIIFQLLFLGRHPFSGAFLGRGDMPLEKAIREFRFAYGPSATARQMKQPPATLPLDAVSTPLVNLFERAFLTSGTRPRSQEWIAPLGDLANSLKQCPKNSGHSYLSTLTYCPWCKIESNSPGLVVFSPIYVAGVATAGSFNIVAIWNQIENVPVPAPLHRLPAKSPILVAPSSKAAQIRKRRRIRSYVSAIALAAFSIILFMIPLDGGATLFLVLLATIGAVVFSRLGEEASGVELRQAKENAERTWRDLQRRWPSQDGRQRFSSKLYELKTRKSEYQNLQTVRQSKLQQLEKQVYQRQLERFLDGYRIDKAHISGIGHARQITLRLYGLETAADITMNAVLSVPGFGPTYAAKLLVWRSNLEQRFIFDPKRGVDPQDKQDVETEIQTRRTKLEQELRTGLTILRQLSAQVNSTHSGLQKSADIALKNLAQTEADLDAANAIFSWIPLAVVFTAAIWAMTLMRLNTSPAPVNLTGGIATPLPSKKTEIAEALSPQQTAANSKSAYDKGVALTKAKKFSEAEAAYVQAITLRPDFADAYHELGYVRFELREFDEAIGALIQAHTLRPKYAETLRVLAQVYEAKENWSEAAKYYREAVVIQPKHTTTQYNLSRALKKIGDLDSAIQAMQEVVKLKPDWGAAHYELGLLYVEIDEPDLAREEYTILTSLDPKLADKLSVMLYE